MFSSFARRLTAWYVGAAVALVLLAGTAASVAAVILYSRFVNEAVADVTRAAESFSARAEARHQTLRSAAAEFERRERRSGIRIFVVQHGPPPHGPPTRHRGRLVHPPQLTIVDGRAVNSDLRALRSGDNRAGVAIATAS